MQMLGSETRPPEQAIIVFAVVKTFTANTFLQVSSGWC